MKREFEFIQAIRGIAAVLVVYYHTGHAPKFGSFGVDIFFVLSGAIMAMLMEQGAGGADFIRRRLVRIWPLYFLLTTAAYAVSCLLPSARTSGNIPELADYLKSIAFIPHQARNGEIVPVLGVGWTLNYEVIFYFCCATACAISSIRRALWASGLTVTVALAAGPIFTNTPAGRFYSNPIILEFIAGLAVWTAISRFKSNQINVQLTLTVLMVLVFMAWSEATNLVIIAGAGEWGRPLRYLLPAMVVVGIAIYSEGTFRRLWEPIRRLMVLIGDASYAIYLTHLFVLGGISILLAKTTKMPITGGLVSCGAVLLSILVGMAFFLWIEIPMQKLLSGRRRQSALNK